MTLIAIEGIDGAGKSTVIEYIEAVSHEFDTEIVTTCEPTDGWTGDVVYEALSSDGSSLIDFFLFLADRVHNVENIIQPALDEGKTVITDRYADSTRAYQTHRIADELYMPNTAIRWWMNDVFEPWNKEPEAIIYLDISVDTALERCEQGDKYEKRENLEQVEEEYRRMYLQRPNVHWVDAEQPVEVVCSRVYDIVDTYT